MRKSSSAGVAVSVIACVVIASTASTASATPRSSWVGGCLAAPALTNSHLSNSYVPTTGVDVKTYDFAVNESNNDGETTRVSIATASLQSFGVSAVQGDIPSLAPPAQLLEQANGWAGINAGFFDLWGAPFEWGPTINDGIPEYMPLIVSNGQWDADWLKAVGVRKVYPKAAEGYATSGQISSSTQDIAIAGLNLQAIGNNTAVVYDTRFVGTTPQGEATIVVTAGVVTATYPNGRAMAVPAGSRVIQAMGTKATLLRKLEAHPEAAVTFADPDVLGFAAKGSLKIGSTVALTRAVNLPTLIKGTTIYTRHFSGSKSPRGALTWIIKAKKLYRIYPTGIAIKPTSTTTVIQFVKPSAALRALKVGRSVTVVTGAPTTRTGFRTTGSVSAVPGSFPVSTINKNDALATGAQIFGQDWDVSTPAGATTITVNIADSHIVKVDSDGNSDIPEAGQYVIQVPAAYAGIARSFKTRNTATVSVNPPASSSRQFATTFIRMRGSITNGAASIPIGALNYRMTADNWATAYNKHWQGENGDQVTVAASTTIFVRNGKILDINHSGTASKLRQTGDVVIQVPSNYVSTANSWSAGDNVTVDLGYQTKGNYELITALGRGAEGLRSSVIMTTCSGGTDGIRPRTALGWNLAGRIWLVTASPAIPDPNNGGYRTGGATIHQMSEWLRELGATDSVLFDGGGSTAMVRASGSGTHRVDLPDAVNDFPWVRSVPTLLAIVPKAN